MDIKLDSNWDLDLTTNPSDLTLVAGNDAIGQHVKQRLWTFRGEWFLDTNLGIGWFQSILKKAFDPVEVETEFIIGITDTPGIESLNYLDLDLNVSTRQLTVEFEGIANNELVDFSLLFPIVTTG